MSKYAKKLDDLVGAYERWYAIPETDTVALFSLACQELDGILVAPLSFNMFCESGLDLYKGRSQFYEKTGIFLSGMLTKLIEANYVGTSMNLSGFAKPLEHLGSNVCGNSTPFEIFMKGNAGKNSFSYAKGIYLQTDGDVGDNSFYRTQMASIYVGGKVGRNTLNEASHVKVVYSWNIEGSVAQGVTDSDIRLCGKGYAQEVGVNSKRTVFRIYSDQLIENAIKNCGVDCKVYKCSSDSSIEENNELMYDESIPSRRDVLRGMVEKIPGVPSLIKKYNETIKKGV